MAGDPMALANALDPSLFANQLQAGQTQALAELLMKQGLTPMGDQSPSVGGIAGRVSPMQGAAKLAALLSGQSMQGQANQQSANVMQQQMQALRSAFPSDGPQGQGPALGAALAGQPQQPQGASPASAMGLPGMSGSQAFQSYLMDPGKYNDAVLKGFTPNDTTISARQGGVDPVVANRLMLIKNSTDPKILGMQQAGMSPEQVYSSIYGEAAKNAEIDRKAGNQFENKLTGEAGMVPKIAENANPIGRPGPTGAIAGVTGIPGSPGVVAGNSAATAAGTNTQTPTVAYRDGEPIHSTKAQDVRRALQISPEQQAAENASALKLIRTERAAMTDPGEIAATDKMIARLEKTGSPTGVVTPEQRPGTVPAAVGQQKTLEERFTSLRDANGQAETTNSYLQNIKSLATKAATGQFSDRLAYANSLLAPFSERATDAVTANNLIDKYSNQIVARLGQGGLGTDAARAILQSAYPSAKMNVAAINDAADNLMGANGMIQAKARLLSPLANSRDAVGYQQKEQTFDQNADPRIWQYANIQEAAKRKAFLQGVLKSDPGFLQKAAKLHDLGAL